MIIVFQYQSTEINKEKKFIPEGKMGIRWQLTEKGLCAVFLLLVT